MSKVDKNSKAIKGQDERLGELELNQEVDSLYVPDEISTDGGIYNASDIGTIYKSQQHNFIKSVK